MSAKLTITGTIAVMKDLKTIDDTKSLKLIIPEHVYQPRDEKTVTIWHTITLWGKDAENAHARLAKGSVIEATCSISYHKTEDGRFYTNFNVREIHYLANFGKNKRPEKQPEPKTPDGEAA